MINIVLVEPEIPSNTGNIVRTAVATGSKVHLVRPLGFDTSDKMLKRAGLDYWKDADITYWDSFEDLQEAFPNGDFWYFSTKAQQSHSDVTYAEETFLVFGKETKGLPEDLIAKNYSHAVRIPMMQNQRSLNLSNSVAVGVYEVLRQRNYNGLNFTGHLRTIDIDLKK